MKCHKHIESFLNIYTAIINSFKVHFYTINDIDLSDIFETAGTTKNSESTYYQTPTQIIIYLFYKIIFGQNRERDRISKLKNSI